MRAQQGLARWQRREPSAGAAGTAGPLQTAPRNGGWNWQNTSILLRAAPQPSEVTRQTQLRSVLPTHRSRQLVGVRIKSNAETSMQNGLEVPCPGSPQACPRNPPLRTRCADEGCPREVRETVKSNHHPTFHPAPKVAETSRGRRRRYSSSQLWSGQSTISWSRPPRRAWPQRGLTPGMGSQTATRFGPADDGSQPQDHSQSS